MNLSLLRKKRIILIYNEGVEGTQSYLKGVLEDIKNYQGFFKSIEGGAWDENEIKTFHKPSIGQVKTYIESVADSEFLLVVFCGHGCSYEGETILEFGAGQDLPLSELHTWVKHTRNLIICDCCRVAAELEPITESLKARIRMFSVGGTITERLKAKLEYQKAIRATYDKISTIGYAASLGETAGEFSKGGYYSYSLLNEAREVAESTVPGVISFLECHFKAVPVVVKLSKDKQHPEYDAMRLRSQLPFVIRI